MNSRKHLNLGCRLGARGQVLLLVDTDTGQLVLRADLPVQAHYRVKAGHPVRPALIPDNSAATAFDNAVTILQCSLFLRPSPQHQQYARQFLEEAIRPSSVLRRCRCWQKSWVRLIRQSGPRANADGEEDDHRRRRHNAEVLLSMANGVHALEECDAKV